MNTTFGITRRLGLRNSQNFQLGTRFRAALIAASLLLAARSGHADAVTDWNIITLETAVAPSGPPDPARWARTTTITHVAIFDAVNSIVGDYEPYLERIDAPCGASPEAAAIAAAHHALVALHPESTAKLDALRVTSLATIPDGPGKNAGIAVGIAAAKAILALRADDGFDDTLPYTPGTRPGDWQPIPPELIPAFRPGLGNVATFGIERGSQFRLRPPPELRSRAYARDFNEVKDVGILENPERSQHLTNIARFYNVTDVDRIYHPAARQISAVQARTLSENARIFALLTIAIWDGAVACFESKYHYNLWRPVTAIRAADSDGNSKTSPDADWQPLVFTPPFPSYPSGHATIGAAARVVLEHIFGPDEHSITLTNPLLPDIVLHYTSFEQITDEIDEARVYGGIHFRFDQEGGARLGRRVGEYVLRHELRPVRRCKHRENFRTRRYDQPGQKTRAGDRAIANAAFGFLASTSHRRKLP